MVKKGQLKGSYPTRKNSVVAKDDKIGSGLAEVVI